MKVPDHAKIQDRKGNV